MMEAAFGFLRRIESILAQWFIYYEKIFITYERGDEFGCDLFGVFVVVAVRESSLNIINSIHSEV
jgi:hypothetical protein